MVVTTLAAVAAGKQSAAIAEGVPLCEPTAHCEIIDIEGAREFIIRHANGLEERELLGDIKPFGTTRYDWIDNETVLFVGYSKNGKKNYFPRHDFVSYWYPRDFPGSADIINLYEWTIGKSLRIRERSVYRHCARRNPDGSLYQIMVFAERPQMGVEKSTAPRFEAEVAYGPSDNLRREVVFSLKVHEWDFRFCFQYQRYNNSLLDQLIEEKIAGQAYSIILLKPEHGFLRALPPSLRRSKRALESLPTVTFFKKTSDQNYLAVSTDLGHQVIEYLLIAYISYAPHLDAYLAWDVISEPSTASNACLKVWWFRPDGGSTARPCVPPIPRTEHLLPMSPGIVVFALTGYTNKGDEPVRRVTYLASASGTTILLKESESFYKIDTESSTIPSPNGCRVAAGHTNTYRDHIGKRNVSARQFDTCGFRQRHTREGGRENGVRPQ